LREDVASVERTQNISRDKVERTESSDFSQHTPRVKVLGHCIIQFTLTALDIAFSECHDLLRSGERIHVRGGRAPHILEWTLKDGLSRRVAVPLGDDVIVVVLGISIGQNVLQGNLLRVVLTDVSVEGRGAAGCLGIACGDLLYSGVAISVALLDGVVDWDTHLKARCKLKKKLGDARYEEEQEEVRRTGYIGGNKYSAAIVLFVISGHASALWSMSSLSMSHCSRAPFFPSGKKEDGYSTGSSMPARPLPSPAEQR
jgi:hypothetical protein